MDGITTTATNISFDTTDDDRSAYLQFLQHRSNLSNIPVFVFMAVVILCGLFGNSLIIYVYSRREKKTSTAVFLQAIAFVDLLTNVAVIPVTVIVKFNEWDFPGPFLCKLHIYLNFSTSHAATTLLLAVAIVRYKKICTPFAWQMTTGQAKMVSVIIYIASCFITIPHAIVHGVHVVQTDRPGITGVKCRLDEKYVNTPWPKVVNAMSLILFLGCWMPLTVMYARIGIYTRRHSRALEDSIRYKTSKKNSGSGSSSGNSSSTKLADLENNAPSIVAVMPTVKNAPINRKKIQTSASRSITTNGKRLADRTTRMLVVVSTVCIMTYLTSLILLLLRFSASSRVLHLNPVSESFYRLFFQAYMVNSAVNPLIYSWWDRSFRKESLFCLKSCIGHK